MFRDQIWNSFRDFSPNSSRNSSRLSHSHPKQNFSWASSRNCSNHFSRNLSRHLFRKPSHDSFRFFLYSLLKFFQIFFQRFPPDIFHAISTELIKDFSNIHLEITEFFKDFCQWLHSESLQEMAPEILPRTFLLFVWGLFKEIKWTFLLDFFRE